MLVKVFVSSYVAAGMAAKAAMAWRAAMKNSGSGARNATTAKRRTALLFLACFNA